MVFPTCASVSTSSGIGKDCSLNIAYNKQISLCQASSLPGASCRDPQALCSADPAFDFSFDSATDVSLHSRMSSLRAELQLTYRPRAVLFDFHSLFCTVPSGKGRGVIDKPASLRYLSLAFTAGPRSGGRLQPRRIPRHHGHRVRQTGAYDRQASPL